MKILHLEDNAQDAQLAHHVFAVQWPDCEVAVATNRAEFLEQLAGGHDIILSDFNLINFNGLEALQAARERVPDIPFIFLSGTIGEDRAIEALRAGANDYVIKDRPKRLIPAMRRALEDAKARGERKAFEAQMQRTQRLENIGMLAAGIAHDFNNVLAPVLMGIPLLRMRLKGSENQLLSTMENSAQRGAGLVRQILSFAHGVTGEPQLIQPRHLLRELLDLMHQTFPKNIQIDGQVEALWPIRANPTQLHQVVLNLCVNARDAMPQGGILTMRAVNQTLDAVGAASITGARPGPYVLIEIADTGMGIPPAVLERIWDPFFTTKASGHGTGLGLSTVRGIMEEHHGVVTVETQPGRGTSFRTLFPAAPADAASIAPFAAAAIPRGRGELILVADDDANVLEITCATLTGHGYRALAARNGTEAVALIAPRSLEMSLLITDLDMPELDGAALAKVARSLNPAVRILLVSGTTNENDARRTPPANGKFLPKPFNADKLLTTIRELLDEPDLLPAPIK